MDDQPTLRTSLLDSGDVNPGATPWQDSPEATGGVVTQGPGRIPPEARPKIHGKYGTRPAGVPARCYVADGVNLPMDPPKAARAAAVFDGAPSDADRNELRMRHASMLHAREP